MPTPAYPDQPAPLEGSVPLGGASLHYRAIGQGQPVIVLHGGPEFSHDYLLPDLDRLADVCRLICYDQRGRGRSAEGVREEVSLESETADLERLRGHFELERVAVLGHSWGGLLALEYAVRHPERVSHLVLLNTAPASHAGLLAFRQHLRDHRPPADAAALSAVAESAAYRAGDPDSFADYCRHHFRMTLREPEQLERLVSRLLPGFTAAGILKARAIEHRLAEQTWLQPDYDLLPRLAELHVPTLLVHGERDFIPVACAQAIAQAIPGARLRVLADCGHFSYLECPDAVRREIGTFLRGT